jgi:hypothetical protein
MLNASDANADIFDRREVGMVQRFIVFLSTFLLLAQVTIAGEHRDRCPRPSAPAVARTMAAFAAVWETARSVATDS